MAKRAHPKKNASSQGSSDVHVPPISKEAAGAVAGAAIGWALKLIVGHRHPIIVAALVLVPYGLCYFGITALLKIDESKVMFRRTLRIVRGKI